MASGDSAWAFQDPQTRQRRNREWILGRMETPLFDVDVNDALSVTAKAITGAVLTTSTAAIYSVPGSGVTVSLVNSITIVNFSGTARAVNLFLGASATLATQIWGDTLQPGEAVTLEGPWFLAVGDSIRADASANTAVTLTGEVLEFKTQPSHLTLKVINGALLSNGSTTYYTVPGSGVRQALLLSATVYNSHTGDLSPTVHRVPSGGSAGNATNIFSGPVSTKESVIVGAPFVLMPGDFIAALASSANLVTARFTVLEAQ